jgi:hypothetical protein
MIQKTFDDMTLYHPITYPPGQRKKVAYFAAITAGSVEQVREALDMLGLLDDLQELLGSSGHEKLPTT